MTQRADREFQVLAAVVRIYSRTGQPVSSALVARWLGGDVSSATVRGDMHRLEQQGLLAKPHTSAGRIPTDAGFRHFVNRLLEGEVDEPGELEEVQALVDREIREVTDTRAMVRSLAALLSRLTGSIGILLGPVWDGVRARRLDLYPKEGRRVLLVLVLDNALVRTELVTGEREYPPETIAAAARLLSERISGLTVAEIRAGALASLDEQTSDADRCALEIVSRARTLFDDPEPATVELVGVGNVLEAPEFSDPDPLKRLLRVVGSPRAVAETLRRLPLNEREVHVWIGSENPVDDLRPFSLVASPFGDAERHGVLAVLGLRRMPYERAIGGVQVILRNLGELN